MGKSDLYPEPDLKKWPYSQIADFPERKLECGTPLVITF
jgi:hypothetical protein